VEGGRAALRRPAFPSTDPHLRDRKNDNIPERRLAVFGIDESIASLSGGDALLLVVAVAVLLGLRHATDPDHLTAVSTLIAADHERHTRRAGFLGLSWGLGHATTLALLGLPIVLFNQYLPDPVVRAAEVTIGFVIIALAARLLSRWRHGHFHAHKHAHDGVEHRHLHAHRSRQSGDHEHEHGHAQLLGRSPVQSYGIGLIHGIGGSAGVGILLLAAIEDKSVGVVALFAFALFTAVSMAIASTAFGYAVTRGPVVHNFTRVAPALGVVSVLFGAWYVLGALEAVPYVF
jgi:ABC-type nickel/cobalt efflux system permease component RcnA